MIYVLYFLAAIVALIYGAAILICLVGWFIRVFFPGTRG